MGKHRLRVLVALSIVSGLVAFVTYSNLTQANGIAGIELVFRGLSLAVFNTMLLSVIVIGLSFAVYRQQKAIVSLRDSAAAASSESVQGQIPQDAPKDDSGQIDWEKMGRKMGEKIDNREHSND